MAWLRFIGIGMISLVALACTPALNWRTVALESSSASALLPCKPERTRREVPLGGVPTDLAVVGCRSGAMTFAVMTARMSDDVETDAVLAGWQQATLANMRAEAATVERSDFRPAGGLPLVHAQRLLARGRGGDGRAVAAQAVWSARAAPGGGAELLHAVVYAEQVQPEVADAFFAGIRW
ncbi:MAG TPA: hypothetical protein PKA16_13890 [Ottowia sp.]|uniref:hypothetical protein n=1 Tax=Ottowia sp. TaxID=1898956 RepID=UPI002C35D010|nr:hypothetical protein [Ottowia sp.]HMN22470.1 hypothetical protein [Ottowia sp.]